MKVAADAAAAKGVARDDAFDVGLVALVAHALQFAGAGLPAEADSSALICSRLPLNKLGPRFRDRFFGRASLAG